MPFNRFIAGLLCLYMAASPSYAAGGISGQGSKESDSNSRLLSQNTARGKEQQESLKPLDAQEAYLSYEAKQAAEILGIKAELQRFRNLQAGAAEAYENENLALKSLLLRKVLLGFIQVRQASNKTDIELAYTYDVYYRERRHIDRMMEFFNLLNFGQLSVLYTVAPYSRINKQFIQANILSEISAGLGTSISILSILYAKYYKAANLRPPKFLETTIEGAAVDGAALPLYVARFLDSPENGESRSRREKMFEFWEKHYDVDPARKETLGAVNNDKRRSIGWLNTRIVLLWSLRNHFQKFDKELLALLDSCRVKRISPGSEFAVAKLSQQAAEAAHLFRIEKQVAELKDLNEKQAYNKRRLELEALIIEQIIAGLLEVRIATDKVDQEINYSYDIARAQLLQSRADKMQKNYEANFIQSGTFVAIAKLLFLKRRQSPANQMLTISGALGTGLSALGIYLGEGGHRRMDEKANSLADILGLDLDHYHFSRVMTEFLNTPSEECTDGKSKREFLLWLWKEQNIGGMAHASNKRLHSLAALPPAKWDTISILTKRIELLFSLKMNLEFLDKDLYALIEECGFDPRWANAAPTDTDEAYLKKLNPYAAEAARLLEVQHPVTGLFDKGKVQDEDTIRSQLSLTRKVMQALLDLRVTSDRLEFEIVKETETRDRMVKARDRGIAFTNNANFFQLGILGMVGSGPFGMSGQKRYRYYSHVINVVSGYLVTGITAASAIQQKGGYRPNRSEPNLLTQVLGLETDDDLKFSPFIWRFLNSTNPDSQTGMTRRQQLLEYWRQEKLLSRNPSKQAAAQKLAANGSSHHWWNETIALITWRINMLRTLDATVDMLEKDLSELLLAAE